MSDQDCEAFEAWVAIRWRLVKDKPDLGGVSNQWTGEWCYTYAETSSLYAAWQAARDHYAPKLSEKEAIEKAKFWQHEYKQLAHAGVERLAEYGHVVDPAEKIIEAAEYREQKALRAAGIRFREETKRDRSAATKQQIKNAYEHRRSD